MNILSKRLFMLAGMVTPGNRLADVGCDHGFLPVYLVQEGICPRALAMDVREGPLGAAREHIREFGLGDYIETRISDGLAQYHDGEADTLVCAGMGGRLMEKILSREMDKAAGFGELILQPQSEITEFRIFLRNSGFRIICEDAVLEEGKYYFAMKAIYAAGHLAKTSDAAKDGRGEIRRSRENDSEPETEAVCGEQLQRLYDLFGKHLLNRRHPVLFQYLRQRKAYLERLEAGMKAACTKRAEERAGEIHRELAETGQALLFFGREEQI